MSFIAVICGLQSEATAVRAAVKNDTRIHIGVSGASAERSTLLARAFSGRGAKAIVSIGVSGGLDPSLEPGDLIIGDRVIAEGGRVWVSDMALMKALSLLPAREGEAKERAPIIGSIYGSDDIIQSAETKNGLFRNHNTIAVDMESHGAAMAAHEASLPFIAIRSIADPASRKLPAAALGAVSEDGATLVLKTLSAALRDPKQFPELMQLGRDSAEATKTLRRNLGFLFDRLFLSLDL